MTEEENEEIWYEVEQITFEAICKVANCLEKLSYTEQSAIHARLDTIATDGMEQLRVSKAELKKMH